MSKGLTNLMKQAQQMQAKIVTLQKELDARVIDVSSGGGMVKIKINGKHEIIEFKLNPECVDPNDLGTLEDLIKTAVNQAIKDSQTMVSSAMSKVTGGINIPGMF